MTRRKLRARLDEPNAFVPLGQEDERDPHARIARKLEKALGHGLRGPAATVRDLRDDGRELVEILSARSDAR